MSARAKTIVTFQLDPEHPPALTPEQQAHLDSAPINYSDIPEIPDDFWTQHAPAPRPPKQQITLRLDQDVVEFFRNQGPSYQTRINAVLCSYVREMRQRTTFKGMSVTPRQPKSSHPQSPHKTRKPSTSKPANQTESRRPRS